MSMLLRVDSEEEDFSLKERKLPTYPYAFTHIRILTRMHNAHTFCYIHSCSQGAWERQLAK